MDIKIPEKMLKKLLKRQEKLSEIEALVELCSELEKQGEISISYSKLGQKWGWTKAQTENFLKKLKKEEIIKTEATTKFMIIKKAS